MMEVNLSKDLSFDLLRNHPEFLEETSNLLNSQWQKSLARRLQYLEEGQDDLPCSLILLQKDDQGQARVIGHSRLNRVLGKPTAAFLTCVIVEKTKRGCGLGKKIMQLTENHASQLGCTTIYLSTSDKYEFYKHLGYQCCSQVTPVKARSSLFNATQLALIREQFGVRESQMEDQEEGKYVGCSPKNSVINQRLPDATQDVRTAVHSHRINTGQDEPDQQEKIYDNSVQQEIDKCKPQPPPPPPVPPSPNALNVPTSRIRYILSKKDWMMKEM